jgi:uncharacterized membrane protein YozB (DUF420 family)
VWRRVHGIVILSNAGFLGSGAPFSADLNLVVQVTMGGTLIAGTCLARKRRYKAHAVCQTSVLVLNLGMIGLLMWPSFLQQVKPAPARAFHKWYYQAAIIHAVLGTIAEVVGIYIAAVAGTKLIPQRFQFTSWKWWMRAELVLWMVVLVSGFGTYCAWYLAPFR